MLTRTDRRRFPVLLAVIAVLAMAMLVSPVQAQEGSAPGGSGTRANVSEPKGEGCTTTTATPCEVDVGGGPVSPNPPKG